ncbi:unnamed protein product, partial [Aureobasidium pullulans]
STSERRAQDSGVAPSYYLDTMTCETIFDKTSSVAASVITRDCHTYLACLVVKRRSVPAP